MRIIYLHQYFVSPEMTGGTRSFEFARRLAAIGHDVHVITSRRDSGVRYKGWMSERRDGFHIHWYAIPYSNRMGFRQRVLAFFRFAWVASRRAMQIQAELVFATSTPLTIAIPAIVASKRQRIPMVFEVRDLWPEVPIAMGALRNPVSRWLARKLERVAYRSSARVIALSQGMADGVARVGFPIQRIVVVPNASDISFFRNCTTPLSWGQELAVLLAGRPFVLYCGTLGRVNGVEYLVRVAACAARLPQATPAFLVVGDGIESEAVRRAAEECGVFGRNFFMKPPIAKAEVPDLLRRAAVAVSLVVDVKELWNNSANKFFDTLAAGKPIAINHGGWQAELLERSGAGIVLSSNFEVAAQQLSELVADQTRLAAAGEAARRLAVEDFDRDKLAQRFIATLQSAFDEHNARQPRVCHPLS
jgi:glycosyltransferase involved in cell wall biosynthesis